MTSRASDEQGSVSVVVVGILAVLLILGGALVTVGRTLVASEKARSSADQAALSAAAVLLGVGSEAEPCAVAQRVAHANGARVRSCRVAETSVQVEVAVPVPLSRDAGGVARAGEPEGGSAAGDSSG